MKSRFRLFVLALLPITLLACSTTPQRIPVAVQCKEMAPVSAWMMEPAKNADLTKNSSKTQPKTPTSSEPGKNTAD